MNKSKRWAVPIPQKLMTDGFHSPSGRPHDLDTEDFCDDWNLKYWKNIPGPFYSTTNNLMSLLVSLEAHDHILYDETCEFYWRQPYMYREFEQCLGAMVCDEIDSYGMNGNDRWTPQLVAEWWERRNELIAWAKDVQASASKDENTLWGNKYVKASDHTVLSQYIAFMEYEAEEYLRSYVFLLLEGRAARPTEALPSIQ